MQNGTSKKPYALILAGGSGTRLWPLSREEMPKQFLSVCGEDKTLLQLTAKRLARITDQGRLRVISSGTWRSLVAYQLMAIGMEGDFFIEEPEGRNTAPAIALGISELLLSGASPDDMLLVCPSDHIIRDEERFMEAVDLAIEASSEGRLVTFGIKPASPDTGFGYIKTRSSQNRWLEVEEFVEKPDEATAAEYVDSGDYYWNGGIFCFRMTDMISAYAEYFPEGASIFSVGRENLVSHFLSTPKQSIDYAVMEKTRNITCIPLDAGWSDVGSWDSVYENSRKDKNDNASTGNVVLHGGRNSLIVGSDRLICGVDLDSMIVVDTSDALFISPRGSSHKLRGVVKDLSANGFEEVTEAPSSARPWGTYKVLSKGGRHKIKKIEVLPGKRLSLQYHVHRSEHWVVVKGAAKVTAYGHGENADGKERLVHEGESFFVPKGKLHRLENPGKIPLEIIEVQIGEYVGEDDISRVEDDYKRS